MIDLNQEIVIKWTTRNKARYELLGYKFTHMGDEFVIKACHLNEDSNMHVTVYCDECGKEMRTHYRNYNRISSTGKSRYLCRKCNAPYTSDIRRENNKSYMIEDFKKMINDIGCTTDVTEDDYLGCDNPMKFKCNIHGEQYLSVNQLRVGCICPECGRNNKGQYNKLNKNDAIQIVSSKNNDVLLNPQDYIDRTTSNLQIQCNCGNIFITNLASIINSSGYCKECAKENQIKNSIISKEELIKSSTIDGICYLLNPEDYTYCSDKNLRYICTSCGDEFNASLLNFKRGFTRCENCHVKSHGERIISEFLVKNNIDFVAQKKFDDCVYKRKLPFDFYIESKNMCIEFDGEQHQRMTSWDNGDESKLMLRQKRDQIKTDYCKNNNIRLIRIPYEDMNNIETILTKELNIA